MKKKDSNLNNFKNIYRLKPLQKLALLKNVHSKYITSVCFLKDGRIVSSSFDKKVLVYNKITFKIEIRIKEKKSVNYININKDGILIVCLDGTFFNLYEIKGKTYKKIQTINPYSLLDGFLSLFSRYYSIIKFNELKNGNLAVILYKTNSICFYKKENNKKYSYLDRFYDEDVQKISDFCELNSKEFCYSCIYDERIKYANTDTKKIRSIKIPNLAFSQVQLFLMNINELFVAGDECIYIIDIQKKEIIKNIKLNMFLCCMHKVSDNIILIGSWKNFIEKLKYDKKKKELKIISKVKYKNTDEIYQTNSISTLNNKLIVCPYDNDLDKSSLVIYQ